MFKRLILASALLCAMPCSAQKMPYVTYQGTFSQTSKYTTNDTVTYSGSTWISLKATNIGNTPMVGSTFWGLFGSSSSSSGESAMTGLRYGNGSSPDSAATPAQVQSAENNPTLNGQIFLTRSNTGQDTFATPPTDGVGLAISGGRLSYKNMVGGIDPGWNPLMETSSDVLSVLRANVPNCGNSGYLLDIANGTCDVPANGTVPSGPPNYIMGSPATGSTSGQAVLRPMVTQDLPASINVASLTSTYMNGRLFLFNGYKVGSLGSYSLSQDGPTFNAPTTSSNITLTLPAHDASVPAGAQWLIVNTNASATITVQLASSDISAGITLYGIAPARGGALIGANATSVTLQPGQELTFMFTSATPNAFVAY